MKLASLESSPTSKSTLTVHNESKSVIGLPFQDHFLVFNTHNAT